MPDGPALLKERRHVPQEDAETIWRNLKSVGWRGTEQSEKKGKWLERWLKICAHLNLKMAELGDQKEKKKRIPQQNPQISGDILLKNAIHYHTQGDLKNAEKAYRAAIDSGLTNVALFSNLGLICQTSQRTEEAISLYKKAMQINANHPVAYTNLGGLYKDLGNLDQALAYTLKSLELKPDNPTALANLGGIYQDLGNLDQALASTLKSLELNPDNDTALSNLGGIYKELDKLDQALAYTLKSLELKPDNPTALLNLGSIYNALGKLDQAFTSTLKSLEFKPDNHEALSNLFNFYGEGDLPILKSTTRRALEHNQGILNNSSYIEVISSLGKDFAKNMITTSSSTNQ